MTDVESKVTASKKSRKNKAPTPIYRTSPMGGGGGSHSPMGGHSPMRCQPPSPLGPSVDPRQQQQPPSPPTAFKPPTPSADKKPDMTNPMGVINGIGSNGGAIKSYSDFMRSLAAKY